MRVTYDDRPDEQTQPAPSWQRHLFDAGADNLAEQGELFPGLRGPAERKPPAVPDAPGQRHLFD